MKNIPIFLASIFVYNSVFAQCDVGKEVSQNQPYASSTHTSSTKTSSSDLLSSCAMDRIVFKDEILASLYKQSCPKGHIILITQFEDCGTMYKSEVIEQYQIDKDQLRIPFALSFILIQYPSDISQKVIETISQSKNSGHLVIDLTTNPIEAYLMNENRELTPLDLSLTN
ncbi:MAG: hypothetical protein KDD46_07710 [Bdellovibrionales bacterium]|nr:hypothetical protein [Bdellovibrionales bacterium]